jgi:hypothetical protein
MQVKGQKFLEVSDLFDLVSKYYRYDPMTKRREAYWMMWLEILEVADVLVGNGGEFGD